LLPYLDLAHGSPVLLLVFSAGPVNISFVDKDTRVEAMMQCFFPAQATGEALFNSVTMATEDASPAGRLPYTWYDTADQVRIYLDDLIRYLWLRLLTFVTLTL
jgi:beta-glucosidase